MQGEVRFGEGGKPHAVGPSPRNGFVEPCYSCVRACVQATCMARLATDFESSKSHHHQLARRSHRSNPFSVCVLPKRIAETSLPAHP